MKNLFTKSIVIVIAVSASSMAFARELARTDRYTLVSMEATSDQAKPLSTITSVSLGRDVDSVGAAIKELLKGSGYRWQSQDEADQLLNELPLPAVVRNMGPIRLSDALQTLAGEVWVLHTDNLNRVVWFEINQSSVKKH
jgi:type IV pili sensor histidine kinase/response regulator